MSLLDNNKTIEEKVLYSMREYLEEYSEDCSYKSSDIDLCKNLLENFISKLIDANKDKDKIMSAVQEVVLALNELNDSAESSLIETEQREDICGFILEAANTAGLITDEDITEEWREW